MEKDLDFTNKVLNTSYVHWSSS